jgi:hypothetical protein
MNIEVYKKTTDDFYPSYEISAQGTIQTEKYVRVILSSISDGSTRVAAWGADDFAMYRDFNSATNAKFCFDVITHSEKPITIKFLEKEFDFKRF